MRNSFVGTPVHNLRMVDTNSANENRFQRQFNEGIDTFCLLFTHWMDKNGWTHPVMLKLFRCCLDGASWFHSSQISAIRQRKLVSPGPRSFMAIAELNRCMHEYATRKRLLPNTKTDIDYLQGYAVTENGEAPGAGWWYEVFCGYRTPTDVPLDNPFPTEHSAAAFSQHIGRLVRRAMAHSGLDLIEDLDRVIRDCYPAGDEARVSKLRAVLLATEVWTPAEAHNELTALCELLSSLDTPVTRSELLSLIG